VITILIGAEVEGQEVEVDHVTEDADLIQGHDPGHVKEGEEDDKTFLATYKNSDFIVFGCFF